MTIDSDKRGCACYAFLSCHWLPTSWIKLTWRILVLVYHLVITRRERRVHRKIPTTLTFHATGSGSQALSNLHSAGVNCWLWLAAFESLTSFFEVSVECSSAKTPAVDQGSSSQKKLERAIMTYICAS